MNPISPSFKSEFLPILLIIISVALSFYFYALLPERVVTHWDVYGAPDGYSSRGFASFFFPFFNLAIYLLMLFVPHLDPQKENYENFRSVYHLVKNSLVAFMTLIYFVVGLNGLGYQLPVNIIISLGIGLLFFLIGFNLKNVKPNWFLGIRTPWTLSSVSVWQRTHKYGGKIFMLGGCLMILAAIFPASFLWFIVLFILLILSAIVYSYLIYKK